MFYLNVLSYLLRIRIYIDKCVPVRHSNIGTDQKVYNVKQISKYFTYHI